MSIHRIRPLGLVAAAALAVSACGDSGDAASDRSPLEALWGNSTSPAEQRAQQLEIEEATAQCMKDEGWDYQPVDWAAQFPDGGEEIDYSSPDFGERYGYGIVRSYELWELPYLDENGEWSGDQGVEDPNQDYVMGLSDDERDQYYATLYGDQSNYEPEIDPDTGEEIWVQPPVEDRGCQGKASFEVQGPQPWDDPDFNRRYEELSQPLQNDPAIDDAELDWSDCMYELDEDYDFYGPDDVHEFVSDFLNEAKGLRRVAVDPDTGEVIGGEPGETANNGWMGDEDGNAWAYVGEQRLLTAEQIERLTEREVALWKADQQCQKESGLKDLRRRLEQDLVDAIGEEFPQFLDRDR